MRRGNSQLAGPPPPGVQLSFKWGQHVLASHFVQPGKDGEFVIGNSKQCDFVCDDEVLQRKEFVLVSVDEESLMPALRFCRSMTGDLHPKQNAQAVTLSHAHKARLVQRNGSDWIWPMEAGDRAQLHLGSIDVEVTAGIAPTQVSASSLEDLDFTFLNLFLVTLTAAALLVVSARFQDDDSSNPPDDWKKQRTRLSRFVVQPPHHGPRTAPMPRPKHHTGKVEDPKAPMPAVPLPARNKEISPRNLMHSLFGSGASTSNVLDGALSQTLAAAIGTLSKPHGGGVVGTNGPGLMGSVDGSSGSLSTVGAAGIATRGRAGGTGRYGAGKINLGGKERIPLPTIPVDVTIVGSLDRELIRQVIHRHRNAIRYCYENELTTNPDLRGKMTIRFVISPAGTVDEFAVTNSDLRNVRLESCVATRTRSWVFPKPKGGGSVVVSYPFVFNRHD